MEGWGKIRPAAKYAGISERTLRAWLQQGLRYTRLPTGTILIRFSAIDEFLESFVVNEDQVGRIVDEVFKDLRDERHEKLHRT